MDEKISLDVEAIRKDFPILERKIEGKKLVYFDNAATSQKPRQVIDTIQTFYSRYNANISRSPHRLGQDVTQMYEQAHENVAKFIGAEDGREVVFVKNTTEAINLLAYSLVKTEEGFGLSAGDEIVTSVMEHHSDLVPWQSLRRKQGIKLKFVDIQEDATLNSKQFEEEITNKTKLVCMAHVSNVIGVINPVHEIGKIAHNAGALFLVDGAQSVPHLKTDVKELNCDFLTFSGHKMLAPMGIGVLYSKRGLLEKMEPFMYGGGMISEVTLEKCEWDKLPGKFEAGTPNVCGAVALGGGIDLRENRKITGAIDYLNEIEMANVRGHEKELTAYTYHKLKEMENVKLYGPADPEKVIGVVPFNVYKNGQLQDSHLVAQFLNDEGIAVRSGGHCAHPLIDKLNTEGTVRASFYIYNTKEEIDHFCESLEDIISTKLI